MPPGDAKKAYLDGLKMLARHELSEARVRDRLARRGYEQDAIDTAMVPGSPTAWPITWSR